MRIILVILTDLVSKKNKDKMSKEEIDKNAERISKMAIYLHSEYFV